MITIRFAVVLLLLPLTHGYAQQPEPSVVRAKTFGESLKKPGKNDRPPEESTKLADNDGETISIQTTLVVNDVLVVDKYGKDVADLSKDDFVVTEQGVKQTVEVFAEPSATSRPRSIVLILDRGGEQTTTFSKSIDAARSLVDNLAPRDQLAIVTTDVKLQIDLTDDKAALKKTLDSLARQGASLGSGLELDTLLAVLQELFVDGDRQRILIFQGDGNEVIWLKPENGSPYKVSRSTLEHSGSRYGSSGTRKFGFSDLQNAIERSQATIYSIVPGLRLLGLEKDEQLARAKTALEANLKMSGIWSNLPPDRVRDLLREFGPAAAERNVAGQKVMLKIAEMSGGTSSFIEKAEDAASLYSAIFDTISRRYSVGYYPTDQTSKTRREVRITVRDHPDYIVTTRQAYFLK